MGTVPVEVTWTTGQVVTSAEINSNLRDAVNFLAAPPRCELTWTPTPFAVANATWQLLSWNTAVVNTDNMWTNLSASRITVQTPGRYELEGNIHFQPSAVANVMFGMAMQINGGGVYGSGTKIKEDCRDGSNVANIGTGVVIAQKTFLNAGDYVEWFAMQTTGFSVSVGLPNSTPYDGYAGATWEAST